MLVLKSGNKSLLESVIKKQWNHFRYLALFSNICTRVQPWIIELHAMSLDFPLSVRLINFCFFFRLGRGKVALLLPCRSLPPVPTAILDFIVRYTVLQSWKTQMHNPLKYTLAPDWLNLSNPKRHADQWAVCICGVVYFSAPRSLYSSFFTAVQPNNPFPIKSWYSCLMHDIMS